MNKYKNIIGYDILDNMITGFITGIIAIGLVYYTQVAKYSLEAISYFDAQFQIIYVKLSLLGGLGLFLIYNYFDKVFAMKGVFIAVILVGIYLLKLMYSE